MLETITKKPKKKKSRRKLLTEILTDLLVQIDNVISLGKNNKHTDETN